MLTPLGKEVFEFVLGVAGSGGFCRTLTFVQPKKPPATCDAECVQRQQFCVYRGRKARLLLQLVVMMWGDQQDFFRC
jgi:hypothetical protein